MLGPVLLVVAAFYTVGGALLIAQRGGKRVGGHTTWTKYATYGLYLAAPLALAELGTLAYTAGVLAVLILALREFGKAVGLSVLGSLFLVTCGLVLAGGAVWGGSTTLYPLAVGLALITLGAGALVVSPRVGSLAAVWTVTGIIAIATPAVHLLLIARDPQRFVLFAFLFLVVSSSDAFAELVGKRWSVGCGVLRASPAKSLSGVVAGLAGALLMAAALQATTGLWTLSYAAVLGLLIWLAATLGDLLASSLKRTLGIKDFGVAIPGHGGVLDRFDSLIFAAWPFSWVIGG